MQYDAHERHIVNGASYLYNRHIAAKTIFGQRLIRGFNARVSHTMMASRKKIIATKGRFCPVIPSVATIPALAIIDIRTKPINKLKITSIHNAATFTYHSS